MSRSIPEALDRLSLTFILIEDLGLVGIRVLLAAVVYYCFLGKVICVFHVCAGSS
jgi:hypothetical protein